MKRWRRFLSRKQNLAALAIVSFFIFIALAAPWLAPQPDPEEFSLFRVVDGVLSRLPVPPSRQAILGSMPIGVRQFQYDVFYTIVWGTRSALAFGLSVALFTALIGLSIGAISAYLGGAVNQITMRFTDAFLAFPIIAGVIIFEQLLQNLVELPAPWMVGPNFSLRLSPGLLFISKFDPLMVALILFSWMPYARLTNVMVLRIKQSDFIQAAEALGAGSGRIILHHLIPNAISPSIVLAARDVGAMVLFQATLTFIGLTGGSAWGDLLAIGRRWILGPGGNVLTYWWVFLPATLALVLFGIGWNLLGDGLNDWLNPRQS